MRTGNPDNYQVRISALSKEDGGGFVAMVPELPGCMSDGETREEALSNVRDAIESWIDTAEFLGRKVPAPREYEENTASGKFLVRLPKDLHAALTEQAEVQGVSLNTLVVSMLSMGLGMRFGKGMAQKDMSQKLQECLVNVIGRSVQKEEAAWSDIPVNMNFPLASYGVNLNG